MLELQSRTVQKYLADINLGQPGYHYEVELKCAPWKGEVFVYPIDYGSYYLGYVAANEPYWFVGYYVNDILIKEDRKIPTPAVRNAEEATEWVKRRIEQLAENH